jgi:hypothetical protein
MDANAMLRHQVSQRVELQKKGEKRATVAEKYNTFMTPAPF